MSTLYGVNRTLKNTGTSNTIEPEMQGGVVRWLYDSYTCLGTEQANDVVQLGGINLPAEARIVDWVIDHGNLANNITLKFGTLADDDEFMAATDCGAAADKKNFTDDGVAGTLGFEVEAGNGQIPTITFSGTPAAVAIKVGIAYVAKG